MKISRILLTIAVALACSVQAFAWMGMPMPELRVEGRYLKDTHGNIVNLHGFAQTYSPWFNEQGSQWSNYDVNACLNYNKQKINQILDAGWDVSFVRMHMDPYWSNKPGGGSTGENDISAFDFERFKKYLDEVFIPMAEHAVSKGLYVVMRPPGVCPDNIAVGDEYHQYLIKVWTYVAQQPKLRNNPGIMFELANEPINIMGTNGSLGNNGQPCFDALKDFFQQIVNAMRSQGCMNILWVPGLCWQMHYSGYANNPIEGDNIGYAVHLYPGWFGSSSSFTDFQNGWDTDVKPVADFAPIMVTEMDWADAEYDSSWGKAHTGEPYGEGNDNFGANFKLIMDKSGNCSWLLFTGPELLAKFQDVPGTPGQYTFLNDPEACPWPVYHWYQEYRAQHDYPYADFSRILASDQGDGRFNNPVIYGDFPDIDVCRVDDAFYMLSTTKFFSPGATIMRSYDLVNWEYCSNPIKSIEDNDAYNLTNGKNSYGRGVSSASLQYNPNNKTFYLLFTTPDQGSYLMTATDPAGEWTKTRLNTTYDDCGLLFDGEDAYVVYGKTNIYISKLDADFKVVETKQVVQGDASNPVHGSRLYHIGDYYYIYCTYSGASVKQTCFRSSEPLGTYEEKVLYEKNSIHYGALVDTPDGRWYTVLGRDNYGAARVPYLIPVTVSNGWPRVALMISNIENLIKPIGSATHFASHLATNDIFRNYTLGKQWQWNHNPDAQSWNLVDRPSYLRLYTASVTSDPFQARNTLTQRIIGCHSDVDHNYATISVDISNMRDGDRAGLAVFQNPMAGVGVKMEGNTKRIYYQTTNLGGSTNEVDGDAINASVVYLRSVVSLGDAPKAEFYYSTDNTTYTRIGSDFTLPYDQSVGMAARYAIYNYATKAKGGYVDIDWFTTDPEFSEDMVASPDFNAYTRESLTLKSLVLEDAADEIVLMNGTRYSLKLMATFADGHTENVAESATYTLSNPDALNIIDGIIVGKCDGRSRVEASYTDPFGAVMKVNFVVESTTFPLVEGMFNPSIYGEGTFDEATHSVTTAQYGFAGWYYGNGLDLSEYRYLVAKVEKTPQPGGLSFRIFDGGYWDGACEASIRTNRDDYDYFMISLNGATKTNGGKIDPQNLHIIGFWSNGGTPFIIKDVYVSNNRNYLEHDGTVSILADENTLVDVYNLQGMLMLQSVTRAQALSQLPAGIYIIGGRKVVIRK